jgi:hypothetical protein
MDRRLVIAIPYLCLALAALTVAGLLSPAGAPAANDAALVPQPAPCPMAERPQALSVLPADGAVAVGPLAPAGMSGEFAHRMLADAGAVRAPSIFVPSDHWRLGTPRTHGGHHVAHRHQFA